MKQKEGFVLRDVCGEKVIVGEGLGAIDFGSLLSLNETAAWLWQKAAEQGDFTIETLTDALCEEYEIDKDSAQKDIAAIIGKWMELGVIED